MKAHPDDKMRNLAIAYGVRRQAKKKMARGGPILSAKDESQSMNSIDEADTDRDEDMLDEIIAKKRVARMADGGEVADLQQSNGDEDKNLEDDLSFGALHDDTYFDDGQIDEQPMDSNEHADDSLSADDHDMVEKIRSRLKMKRGL